MILTETAFISPGTMKFSWFWSLLFFMMLITLGLDSTFGGLEAMITGLW